MDDKGYTITPMAFLLLIPVIIFAVAFGDIVNEINQYSTITIGSDVTGGTVSSIYSSISNGAGDAGRYAAYRATRDTIDRQNFLSNSKDTVRDIATDQLNAHVIDACRKLSNETGRDIYINNVLIPANSTNQTFNATFKPEDITVEQVDGYGNADPYGFYVVVKAGVPIKVVQRDQVFEGTLPEMRGYAPIQGLEDPYIWIKSKFRTRNAIYQYPYYEESNYEGKKDYHFDDTVVIGDNLIQNLQFCLNGTDNPENYTPMSYYFPNPNGLNFFERLQGGQISGEPAGSRISTFVIGDPLSDVYKSATISKIDVDYYKTPPVSGTNIVLGSGSNARPFRDPSGSIFYLSSNYKTVLGLSNSYTSNVP
ncbi:MAG: hypothetical protein Q4P17_04275 [Methanobacterium sp.]|nr:hypothetical protein [Methanobacterium sp.]